MLNASEKVLQDYGGEIQGLCHFLRPTLSLPLQPVGPTVFKRPLFPRKDLIYSLLILDGT